MVDVVTSANPLRSQVQSVFGPMFDLKLLFIYSAVFRKRFIAGLAAGLFVLIGLICVRLRILGL